MYIREKGKKDVDERMSAARRGQGRNVEGRVSAGEQEEGANEEEK